MLLHTVLVAVKLIGVDATPFALKLDAMVVVKLGT